jgi:hypothetical protein
VIEGEGVIESSLEEDGSKENGIDSEVIEKENVKKGASRREREGEGVKKRT